MQIHIVYNLHHAEDMLGYGDGSYLFSHTLVFVLSKFDQSGVYSNFLLKRIFQ